MTVANHDPACPGCVNHQAERKRLLDTIDDYRAELERCHEHIREANADRREAEGREAVAILRNQGLERDAESWQAAAHRWKTKYEDLRRQHPEVESGEADPFDGAPDQRTLFSLLSTSDRVPRMEAIKGVYGDTRDQSQDAFRHLLKRFKKTLRGARPTLKVVVGRGKRNAPGWLSIQKK